MEEKLKSIISGDGSTVLMLTAKDLREVILSIMAGERRRADRAKAKEAERPCLTTRQVAEQLGVHPHTVDTIRGRGELAAVKVGRGVRFRQSDVDDYLSMR